LSVNHLNLFLAHPGSIHLACINPFIPLPRQIVSQGWDATSIKKEIPPTGVSGSQQAEIDYQIFHMPQHCKHRPLEQKIPSGV
jgi:hypothetical protein